MGGRKKRIRERLYIGLSFLEREKIKRKSKGKKEGKAKGRGKYKLDYKRL